MAFQILTSRLQGFTGGFRLLSSFAPILVLAPLAFAPVLSATPSDDAFSAKLQPFLSKNCVGCHNAKLKTADLSLEAAHPDASVAADPEKWEKVLSRLRDGTMPPKGLPRPPQAEVESAVKSIGEELAKAESNTVPDPGRVTARRLNRAEYNNTVRDLLGVDLHPADDFPQDDSGYGFDNIGDVLSLSPVLLERYLKAADKVVHAALFGQETLKPTVLRAQPAGREFPLLPKALTEYDQTGLSMPNALHTTMRFPADGDYVVKVALEGRRPNGSEPLHIGLWIDGKQAGVVDIDAPSDGGSIDLFGAQKETKLHITAGSHWLAAAPLRLYEGLPASYGGPNPTSRPLPPEPDYTRFLKIPPNATPEQIEDLKKRAIERRQLNKVPANRVWVHWVEAIGPYNQAKGPVPASRSKLLVCGAKEPGCERRILGQFARRAFRRSVSPEELQPYLKLVASSRQHGASFDEAIGTGLQAILVSPDFLFRIEKSPSAPASKAGARTVAGKAAAGKTASAVSASAIQPIDQYALATRLSYLIWSSTPDDELLQAAGKNELRGPALAAQVTRMMKDPRSHALVENFAGQWLELRRLESVAPDHDKFPEFDDYLRMSMRQETEMFFANMIRENRPILDLLDAKYTFLNQKLAEFYGIPGVKGNEFRRVDLTGTQRGGVLTQASVLTVSSYATRTSPVLRGKWILENFLNQPIPPPPPNVPALDEAKIGASGSMRQQMEEHRKNPACAGCHSKMDPLGFGFENYNAIGEWRTKDGKFAIDASGTLPDGRAFQGPDELKSLFRKDRDAFAECVTDKLLTYALGRGLERYDRRTIKEVAAKVAADDYKFSTLILEIVNSLPFQMHRGEQNKS